jgi:sugar-phosphatase
VRPQPDQDLGDADLRIAAVLLAECDAVLSDLDGTLVDSSDSVRRVWGAFAARHSLDPDAVYDYVYGRPPREAIPVLVPDADHAAELASIERAELRDTVGVRALPGAAELMRSGRRLAIVTSCTDELARARLRAAGLAAPDVLVSADDVENGKPDPTCFRVAAGRLGVSPTRCVVLEDAPTGILAGRGAGAKVIALRTTRSEAALQGADAIIDHLGSIPGLRARPFH